MENGAKALPEMVALKASDSSAFKARAHTIRTDGAWIDSGENDTAIVQTLIKESDRCWRLWLFISRAEPRPREGRGRSKVLRQRSGISPAVIMVFHAHCSSM